MSALDDLIADARADAYATADAAHTAAYEAADDAAEAAFAAHYAAVVATRAAADRARADAYARADADAAAAADAYRRMAIALVRIAELEPLPELDARILTVLASGSTLNMDFYHACATTHCRAGFAVTIHPRGMELEEEFGPHLTGAAIYLVSTGAIPDFFASNEDAMASIRKGATR